MKIVKNIIPFFKKQLTFKYDIVAPIIATGLVLISGTFISFMIAQNQSSQNQNERNNYVSDQFRSISDGVTQRLRAYEQFVIAGSSLIRMNEEITRSEWQGFVEVINDQEDIFGNNAAGYLEKVNASELKAFENRLRAEGLADAGVFPRAEKSVYYPVKFVEPLEGINRSAVGYDLFSDSVRRMVAESARDSGNVSLTPPINMVQNPDEATRLSVIVLYPVYRQGAASPQTPKERREAIQGYTFTVIQMTDLAQRLQERMSSESNAFRITDITNGTESHLYSTDNFDELSAAELSNVSSQDLSVLGREWKVDFVLEQHILANSQASPLLIFALSMLLNAAGAAFLFLLMIHRQARLAMVHEQEVQKTKDDLLALASHQLRTPATGVKQYVGMVLAGYAGKLTPEQTKMLTKANESNERQLEIINQLLYVAKADAGQLKVNLERLNIVNVMNRVVDEQSANANARNVKIRIRGQKPLFVTADPSHVSMILDNLLSNAVKYSYQKGIVTISFTNKRDCVAVHVADKGVGVSESERAHLFKKFSRIENKLTKQVGGSGIGLYLSQELALANRGKITVTSKEDKGSVFTLLLPKKSQKVS